jgi:WD40 repeat protein
LEHQTGELAARPSRLDGELNHLVFSPDDRYIAFSYHPSFEAGCTAIWIWDVRTGRLASGPWKGHTSYICGLTFSFDGEKLASGSWDGQLRIWNTADLLGHSQLSVEGSPDETHIKNGWAVSEIGDLLFWVPRDHRGGLFSPRNITVMEGEGIPTQLDLTRFRYRESWTECFCGGK